MVTPELTSIEGRGETTKEESRMMGFDLIVLATFILVILGIHVWCSFSELKHPPRQKTANSGVAFQKNVISNHRLARPRKLTGSPR